MALGAEHGFLALVAVLVASIFVVGQRFLSKKARRHNLLLTVTGEGERFFEQSGKSVVNLLRELTQGIAIQRFDIEDGQVQFRANVELQGSEDAAALMSQLQSKLPKFHVSYVNLDTLSSETRSHPEILGESPGVFGRIRGDRTICGAGGVERLDDVTELRGRYGARHLTRRHTRSHTTQHAPHTRRNMILLFGDGDDVTLGFSFEA